MSLFVAVCFRIEDPVSVDDRHSLFEDAYCGCSISILAHDRALVGFALSGYGRSHMAYGRLSVLSVLGVAVVVAASIAGSLAVAG